MEKEPFEIIQWFTKHFDNEIGALGVGQVKNGEMVISKLVFPTQIINGAHVHFKPTDWASVVAELTDDEFKNIIFYWHKHPDNCPGASSGDEEDTFDVFMGEESKRKIFGFLQTANSPTGMKYEAVAIMPHIARLVCMSPPAGIGIIIYSSLRAGMILFNGKSIISLPWATIHSPSYPM